MTLPRRVAIGLWIVLPILAAIGLTRLHFDVEVLDLLPSDVAAVQGLKLYQQQFSNARELIVTVRAPTGAEAEGAARRIAEKLRSQSRLVAQVTWQPPWLEHPSQAAELIGYLWLNQPPAVFDQLTNRLGPGQADKALAAAREQLATSMSPADIARLSYDPFGLMQLPESVSGAAPNFAGGQNLFSSSDGTFRILFVEASAPLATYKDCAAWLEAIKRLVGAALANNTPAGLRINYTGRPAFVTEISSGMQHDITISVGGTSVIIAILFWLAHRRVKPMLWLLTLLALVLAGTLALGGLIFGAINVVSMGFAAILLGLAVDYAVVHYQEALAHPDLSVPEIRRAIAPSIFWAAVTTITAFLVLNLGGLPGLGQLGTLVGVGVALAAFVMIFAFLPPLFPDRRKPRPTPMPAAQAAADVQPVGQGGAADVPVPAPDSGSQPGGLRRPAVVFSVTGALILFAIITLVIFGAPKMDATANALRPRHSPAYATLDEIERNFHQEREPLWLLVSGTNVTAVARRLDGVQSALRQSVSNGTLRGFTLPTMLWPRPAFQAANRAAARRVVAERPRLHAEALTNGFTESSLAMTDAILDTWRNAAAARGVYWPTNDMSRWIFGKLVSRTPTNFFALGLLYPGATFHATDLRRQLGLQRRISASGRQNRVWLSGWELLGEAILSAVTTNLWKLVLPMVGLVLLSLWFAFRRPLEMMLSLTILLLSGICLLAAMRLAGWSWNLLNLMAVPLILGTGVDYSIFMQLALRREGGDVQMAWRSVGRALLLCGGTAITGFGALGLSSNAGMASLGRVCAVGIGCNVFLSVFLLPTWWKRVRTKRMTN